MRGVAGWWFVLHIELPRGRLLRRVSEPPLYPEPWEDVPSCLPRDPLVEDKIAKLAQRHNIVCSIDPFDVKRTRAFRLLADFQGVGSSEQYRHWSRDLRHRENMVRIAQNLVRMYELPEPQDCAVLEWQPTMSHYDRFFMPDRTRAICDEMYKYNNFPGGILRIA